MDQTPDKPPYDGWDLRLQERLETLKTAIHSMELRLPALTERIARSDADSTNEYSASTWGILTQANGKVTHCLLQILITFTEIANAPS